jgi:hypothetical protein
MDVSRRRFAAAAAPFLIVPRYVLGGQGHTAPSDRVNVGCVGMGHQGFAVMLELLARPDVRITSVCDVNRGSMDYVEYSPNSLMKEARELLGRGYENWAPDLDSPGEVNLTNTFRTSVGMGGYEPARRLVDAFYESRKLPGKCTAYADYREMLEKEKDLDGVYVATPDHWHAPIALAAMKKGKHVLGQKPMTHTVAEARRVAAAAKEMKVATSVTINNPSTPESKTIAAWLADGAIGKVREVHNWSSRPFWPQGVDRPAEAMPVPAGLEWNLWLGPAPERPYNKIYLPFSWRGWYDFGCGSFGDMGCYSFAGLYRILNLTPPTSVEASASDLHSETYPLASMVHLNFPANGGRGPIALHWYDGTLTPPRPAGLNAEDQRLFERGQEGVMYVGDKGLLIGGFNGSHPRVYPESKKYVWTSKKDSDEVRIDPAVDQWVKACKGGPAPLADFPSQSAPTEAFLLGCIAQRMPGTHLDWDSAAMKVTSSEAANKYIDPPYRGNWA